MDSGQRTAGSGQRHSQSVSRNRTGLDRATLENMRRVCHARVAFAVSKPVGHVAKVSLFFFSPVPCPPSRSAPVILPSLASAPSAAVCARFAGDFYSVRQLLNLNLQSDAWPHGLQLCECISICLPGQAISQGRADKPGSVPALPQKPTQWPNIL